MKLFVLADLHLDEIVDPEYLCRLGTAIHEVGQDADAMIVAGDLTEAAAQKWPDAIRWLGTVYPVANTVIIPGNHDYYGANLSVLDRELERICAESGVGFGQCRTLVFGGVRVLMTTLWTDFRLLEGHGETSVSDSFWHATMMPDYGTNAITFGELERPLRPSDTAALHQKQLAWLVSELARPWEGRTVVVTHHAPSGAIAGEITLLSPCFASDLENEIERYRPYYWLFGHTHRPGKMQMPGGTVLQNISVGYEDELRFDELEHRVRCGLIDLGSEPAKHGK